MKPSLVFAALIAVPSWGNALCVATTQNLIRLEIDTCQRVVIDASAARPPQHAPHARGSRVRGILIAGRVVQSDLVWDGDPRMADYITESKPAPVDEWSTFFVDGNAAKLCPGWVGKEKTFVTDQLCCDVIPAGGLCLVPSSLTIVREETEPQRWHPWRPSSD